MSQAANHRRQIDDGVQQSLLRAGIGRAFHRRSLTELPRGEQLAAWVRTEAKADLAAGRGWTVQGTGIGAYDHVVLLARAMHLSGMGVRVVPLRKLLKLIEVEAEDAEELAAAPALFVTDFVQHYGRGECPLSGLQLMDVETFLTARLDDGRPFFPQVSRPVEQAGWWSPSLAQRLLGLNRVLQVAA